MSFNLFRHTVSFQAVDPLGDGLREEIETEQLEPQAITLEEGIDESQLSDFWQQVQSDIAQDPEWFHFSEEE